jgi:TIR domain
MMKFDTFISYSSADKATADAVCAKLEGICIRCWIAPRDVVPGREYAAAIIDAIDCCRVMVLIFSADANESRQIHREIERAASKGTPIVPLRIEEVTPTESMEYFLGGIHWLDALTPPLERHLQRLAETVEAILQVDGGDRAAPQADWKQPARPPRTNPGPAGDKGRRRLVPRLALALLAVTLAAGVGFVWHRYQPTVGDAPASLAPPPRLAQSRALVPETVPFISDRARMTIRSDYLPGADHKALAISHIVYAFVTDQPDDAIARQAAMDKCNTARALASGITPCLIYAVGNEVVNPISAPMPRSPWLIRNPAIERPFSAKDLPLLGDQSDYAKGRKSKALALSARGSDRSYLGMPSVEEAARRALESCGYLSGAACTIIAVDDVFVVPVPSTVRVTGFFAARGNNLIAPEWQEALALRLEQAPNAWNAIAVGASGRPGLVLDALNEQDAIKDALADCAKNDRDCRLIAMGPFAVSPTLLHEQLLNRLTALSVSAAAGEAEAKFYEAGTASKAIAVNVRSHGPWTSSGWPSEEAAITAALEKCQVRYGDACTLVAVGDKVEPASNGSPVLRDMPRTRYGGTFDPEQIPGADGALKGRADIVSYRSTAGPKAAAYHPQGQRMFIVAGAAGQFEAEESALNKCNNDPDRNGRAGPCFLYAVGDQVVLPQRSLKPLSQPPPAPPSKAAVQSQTAK